MKATELYNQLESAVLPMILHYQTDLTKIDRELIERFEEVPFLHGTRSMGTHMIFMNPTNYYPAKGEQVPYLFGHADREHLLREKRSTVEYIIKECKILHHFNGTSLKLVTPSKCLDIIDEYTADIKRFWARGDTYKNYVQSYECKCF